MTPRIRRVCSLRAKVGVTDAGKSAGRGSEKSAHASVKHAWDRRRPRGRSPPTSPCVRVRHSDPFPWASGPLARDGDCAGPPPARSHGSAVGRRNFPRSSGEMAGRVLNPQQTRPEKQRQTGINSCGPGIGGDCARTVAGRFWFRRTRITSASCGVEASHTTSR